jgi:ATP-dependent RNA helicase DHX8/PRP22
MADILNDLERLEKLSLVSKICTELENHLGLNDKDLAEYIIHLAETNDTFDKFKVALSSAGGPDSFPDSFAANLLRIIQRMNPSMRNKQEVKSESVIQGLDGPMTGGGHKVDLGLRKVLCPALAMPNQKISISSDEEDEEVKTNEEDKKQIVSNKSSHDDHDRKSKKKDKDRERDRDADSYSKKKKKHKHSSRSRSRSRSRSDSRSPRRHSDRRDRRRSRSRSRSRSRDRDRRSGGGSAGGRDRDREASSFKKPAVSLMEPVVGEVYQGTVASIMQFGCFVQLNNFRKKTEGLVHISNLRPEGRVNAVTDVVTRHQKVWVKVTSLTSTKVGLSMKEVDQATGKDLNPQNSKRLKEAARDYEQSQLSGGGFGGATYSAVSRNPDRPESAMEAPVDDDDAGASSNSKKKVKQISDFEKWELQQLLNANAIQLTDLPFYDEDTGVLQKEEEEEDVDVEIELVEDECVFLKGKFCS